MSGGFLSSRLGRVGLVATLILGGAGEDARTRG